MPSQLSHEEIERMRQIVQMHDSERKPMTIVDLNNPPKEPYYFQKFPMAVYADGSTQIVHTEEQLAKAQAEGWSQDAGTFRDEHVEHLSARYQAEASRLDAALEKERRNARQRKHEVA